MAIVMHDLCVAGVCALEDRQRAAAARDLPLGAETSRAAGSDFPLHLQKCAVESGSTVFAGFLSESLSVCLSD
jgi:hypothetical protein